jgi:hypothetical protein
VCVLHDECLTNKLVVETERQFFTWLLIRGTVIGALVKFIGRWEAAEAEWRMK